MTEKQERPALRFVGQDDQKNIDDLVAAGIQVDKEEIARLRAEVAGLKTGYEAYERVNAELKQKVANLEVCQTASLGMSGIIKCVAGELGFDAAAEDSANDYLIGLARQANVLKAENEALKAKTETYCTYGDDSVEHTYYGDQAAIAALTALVFEVEALRKDAERYRWLRNPRPGQIEAVEWVGMSATPASAEYLDEILDADMGKGEKS